MDAAHEFYTEVGRRIRAARTRRKLSQASLASVVGLARTSISNIEKGRQRLLLHTFQDIAETLGVEPATLLPSDKSLPGSNMPKKRSLAGLPAESRAFIEEALGGRKES